MSGNEPDRSAGGAPYHRLRRLGRGVLLAGLATAGCSLIPGPDPSGIRWQWRDTREGGVTVAKPRPGHPYTLLLASDGMAGGRADCNRYQGSWERRGERLTFGPLAATRAFCGEASRDGRYLADLQRVVRYRRVDNELVLYTPKRQMRFITE